MRRLITSACALTLCTLVAVPLATAAETDAQDHGTTTRDPTSDSYADAFVDTEIRDAALAALSSQPATRDVRVEVTNGVATLTGSVADADAAITAVRAAYTAGARRVENQVDRRDLDH